MFSSDQPATDADLAALCDAISDAAAQRVYDVATVSPSQHAPGLSAQLGASVYLKREDTQPVFSFKLRGAYNKIVTMPAAQRQAGIVAASAGNHAQGVALAGQKLGLKTTIVMPETTPSIKVDAVRGRGAHVVLHGDNYNAAAAHGMALADETGQVFVHPYDDPLVMAGQGTVGKELLEQHPDGIDVIYVPVGGGGLLGGVSAWVKQHSPDTEIVAVEPVDAACLQAALDADERVVLDQVGIFADGVAVKQIGAAPFAVARRCVDHTIQCDVDAMCAAMRDVFEATRSVPEPAGALALAGLRADCARRDLRGKTLVAIASGANVNFDRLRFVAERTALGAHKEALLGVTIPEKPGTFHHFCEVVGKRAITEFNYRYAGPEAAHILVGVELREGDVEKAEVMARLQADGCEVADLSGDELAKLHVRHMVGGRVAGLSDERLYRVQFPERPGALLEFLARLGSRWNITLFHYRNHGAEAGRVLLGMQVPDAQRDDCEQALQDTGFWYQDESESAAYRLFL